MVEEIDNVDSIERMFCQTEFNGKASDRKFRIDRNRKWIIPEIVDHGLRVRIYGR